MLRILLADEEMGENYFSSYHLTPSNLLEADALVAAALLGFESSEVEVVSDATRFYNGTIEDDGHTYVFYNYTWEELLSITPHNESFQDAIAEMKASIDMEEATFKAELDHLLSESDVVTDDDFEFWLNLMTFHLQSSSV